MGAARPLVCVTLLAGCMPVAAPPSNAADSDLSPSGHGSLKLLLTDAPIEGDVSAVRICLERVEVTFAGDERPAATVLEHPGTFDLLQLQNGVTATIGAADLPVGFLQQIRVILCAEGNTIVVDGVEHPLMIPSGEESNIPS